MTKTEAAFHLSCDRLAEQGRLYMRTFTFAEVLDIKDTRKRWNHLLTLIRRKWPEACGLRVFEMHKEHGLHVHLITNKRIDVNECRKLSKRSGWGRIHVMRMPKDRATYLAKYLSKDRPKAFKRWRLWAGFGKCWDWTKVSHIQVESLYAKVARGLAAAFGWKGNHSYYERKLMIEQVVENTILNGWERDSARMARLIKIANPPPWWLMLSCWGQSRVTFASRILTRPADGLHLDHVREA